MIDYTKLLPSNKYSIYFPAMPPGFAEFWARSEKSNDRQIPAELCRDDFNIFNVVSTLFVYMRALMSAGLALGKSSSRIPPAMITDRSNRPSNSIIMWDSGGFQLIRDKIIWLGDKTRQRILDALEYYADIAICLDIPPFGKSIRFTTFGECLETTVENLRYFQMHRKYVVRPIFLNVLHGETVEESQIWYDTVKHFLMEGWAFSGKVYENIDEMLRRIISMRDEYMFDNKQWVHVLGTSRLSVALTLSSIQQALSKNVGHFVQFSYDSSSPFTMAYGSHMAYLGYAIDKSGLVMKQHRFPDYDNSPNWQQLAFPSLIQTALSNRLMLSDICLPTKSVFANSSWDTLSYHLLAHHNLEMVLNAIIGAHRIYDLDANNADGKIPDFLIRSKIGIEEVFTSECPMTIIDRYQEDFRRLFTVGRSMIASDITHDYDGANRG